MKKIVFVIPFLVLSCFFVIIFFPCHAEADKYACVDPMKKYKPRMISNPKECPSPNALITISDADLAKIKEELAKQGSGQKKGTRPTMSRSRTVCKTFCGILNCCITYCCDSDGYCWIEDSLCPPRIDK